MGKLRITLTSAMGILFFSFGIANLIAGKLNSGECGMDARPPLLTWSYGTGISYITLGLLFVPTLILLMSDVKNPAFFMLILGGLFSTAWTITGALSCFNHMDECAQLNYPVWSVSFATIVSFIMVIPSLFILIPAAIIDF